MVNPSFRELLEILYPGVLPLGMATIYTITLKSGNERTLWCLHPPQADRLCQKFRNTRQVSFGPALQSQEKALAIAHERRRGAQPPNIRGSAASVTAVPALWAIIPYGTQPLPPDLAHALGLLEALRQRASIVISTAVAPEGNERHRAAEGSKRHRGQVGGVVYAVWLLRRPWVFAEEDGGAADRKAAGALLGRVQGAVARLAAERGHRIGIAADLAAAMPLPGFPTGATAGGPRATIEAFPLLPANDRYRRQEFDYLPEPPAPEPQLWAGAGGTPANGARRPAVPFAPIADGCSWIHACRAERATLSPEQLSCARRLLASCAGAIELFHELHRGHPGYDPVEVERLLARELRAPGGPITCAQIGKSSGVVERHCSKCPHLGMIEAPVELASRELESASRLLESASRQLELAGQELPGRPAPARATGAPQFRLRASGATSARTRIVITSRRHEVNDQALAALAAGAELFERRGTLVELVRYPGAAPSARRVTESRLEELLSRHCEFVEVPRDGGEPREVPPPRWTTRGLLARRRWPELPQLEGGPESRAPDAGFGPSSSQDGLGQKVELQARVSGALEAESNPTVSPFTDRQTKEEPRMNIDDLWDSHGPSPADLRVLERLGRHRRAIEDLKPTGEHQSTVRERVLGLLNDMEETLCEEGRSAPSLAEAWQELDQLEERYWESGAAAAAPSPSAARPEPVAVAATSPSPDAGTALAANDSVRSPKAA